MKKLITEDYYPIQDLTNDCTLCDLNKICSNSQPNYISFNCTNLVYKKKTKVPQEVENHLQEVVKLYREYQQWYMLIYSASKGVNTKVLLKRSEALIYESFLCLISNDRVRFNTSNYMLKEYKQSYLYKQIKKIQNGTNTGTI